MAFQNINELNWGNLLQIIFSNGVRNQLSSDYRDFEMVKSKKAGSSVARELRYMLQSTLGDAAVQYVNPGVSGRAFPQAQQASSGEYIAKFKELNTTIEIEYNLWSRAQQSPEKYGEPLALEIEGKATASKRRIAADLYGDGSGVVGTVGASAVAVTSPNSNSLDFTLSLLDAARGHAGMFNYGDILILRTAAAAASALNTSLATEPIYWKVVDRTRESQVVRLQGLDASFAPVATITSVTTPAAASEVFYRFGQPTIPDLTAVADYGSATEVMVGLESLVAADGRTVNGMVMSGALAGTQYDAGGNPIDTKHIQRVMSKVKTRVGQDRYSWKQMVQAPETMDAFIESRETDRRFISVKDDTRGVMKFMYQHGNDSLECVTSEFCLPKRIYIMPEQKSSEKVLEFHGSDFTPVKAKNGDEFRLKPSSSGGHVNIVSSYLQAVGLLLCKHPAAIAVIRNFTNA